MDFLVAEQMLSVLMDQKRREFVEVVQPVLVERLRGRVAYHMVVILVPPVMEQIVAVAQEVVRLVPQPRVQRRTVEHAPVPQILEGTVEVALAPERTSATKDCRACILEGEHRGCYSARRIAVWPSGRINSSHTVWVL